MVANGSTTEADFASRPHSTNGDDESSERVDYQPHSRGILILLHTHRPSSDTLRFATGCPVVPTANDGQRPLLLLSSKQPGIVTCGRSCPFSQPISGNRLESSSKYRVGRMADDTCGSLRGKPFQRGLPIIYIYIYCCEERLKEKESSWCLRAVCAVHSLWFT